ncbi:unnamed protein product [Dibothriocephalus latus]|uniref:Uncharacterized protein n=1 Tax=Dibothriocephalus latus TaxID=60516 RepID=A0A3P7N1R6_DIBLA|nr:unnamed protein product [Dibothriocephalus latus]
MKNFILSSNSAGNSAEVGDLVTAYTELREEVEELRENYRKAKESAEQLTRERDFLKAKVNERQIYSDQGTSSSTEDDVFRSSNGTVQSVTAGPSEDFARRMQQLREEKDKWERYANRLVEKVMETHPEILDSAVANNSANLSEFDRKLYQSMRRQRQTRQAVATACQDARVETAESVAQTRRRRIDKIRDFFRRHKKH